MGKNRIITIDKYGNQIGDTGWKDDGFWNTVSQVEYRDEGGNQISVKRTSDWGKEEELMTNARAEAEGKAASAKAKAADDKVASIDTKKENLDEITGKGSLDALTTTLKRIQEREAEMGGNIATRRGMAESDIERMRAEAYGGKYGYDTNKDGMISDDERTMEIDPRMSTIGRTELNQRRSDNSRGLLSSTLSQGDTARGNNALNRALGQFQGETMKGVNEYEMGQRETLRGMNDQFDSDRALLGQQAGAYYGLEDETYTDPTTGQTKTRKKVTMNRKE